MDKETFSLLQAQIRGLAIDEHKKKGDDYALLNQDDKDPDRLWNFKVVGELCHTLGLDGPDIKPAAYTWAVYFFKHVLALTTALKGKKLQSESLYSRAADLHNYIDLGVAIAVEIQPKELYQPEWMAKMVKEECDKMMEESQEGQKEPDLGKLDPPYATSKSISEAEKEIADKLREGLIEDKLKDMYPYHPPEEALEEEIPSNHPEYGWTLPTVIKGPPIDPTNAEAEG